MTRTEIESLVKRYVDSPESLTNDERELLDDACANFGQQLDNIKHTVAIVNIVERFIKE